MNHASPPAQALTVLTPLRPGGAFAVKAAFWVGDRFPSLLNDLRTLSFIHFARWAVVPSEPGLGCRALLLFESDFDGDWNDYIDSFAEVLALRMKAIWGTSYGFPGPRPTDGFRAYIRRNQLVPRVCYAAVPGATTTQVLAALKLRDAHRSLQTAAADPAMDDATFAARWRGFLTEVQFEL